MIGVFERRAFNDTSVGVQLSTIGAPLDQLLSGVDYADVVNHHA